MKSTWYAHNHWGHSKVWKRCHASGDLSLHEKQMNKQLSFQNRSIHNFSRAPNATLLNVLFSLFVSFSTSRVPPQNLFCKLVPIVYGHPFSGFQTMFLNAHCLKKKWVNHHRMALPQYEGGAGSKQCCKVPWFDMFNSLGSSSGDLD
jgi:hypothetical protein